MSNTLKFTKKEISAIMHEDGVYDEVNAAEEWSEVKSEIITKTIYK